MAFSPETYALLKAQGGGGGGGSANSPVYVCHLQDNGDDPPTLVENPADVNQAYQDGKVLFLLLPSGSYFEPLLIEYESNEFFSFLFKALDVDAANLRDIQIGFTNDGFSYSEEVYDLSSLLQ